MHGLEGARDYALASRVLLRPRVEVGLRHDGEGAETGAGLEVGGGLVVSYSSTGLTVNLRVRMLGRHQAEGFRDRAMAVSLSYNPRRRRCWALRHGWRRRGVDPATSGTEAAVGPGLAPGWRPAFPRGGKLASRTGMGRDGFPHGVLSAPERRTDHATAHVLSVQAQVSEQVKHLGDREVPICLRIGGAPLVTAWLRRGRPLSLVTLDRPRGQRRGKRPALFVMPHREAIQRLPIVGVMRAGRDVVP